MVNAWTGLLAAVPEDKLTSTDLEAQMEEVVPEAIRGLDKDERGFRKRLRIFRKVRARTKNKHNRKNILAEVLDDQIQEVERKLVSIATERAILARMADLIAEHGYDYDLWPDKEDDEDKQLGRTQLLKNLSGDGPDIEINTTR